MAFLGGAIIGLSALFTLAAFGRVAGISGIAQQVLCGPVGARGFALPFVLGLIAVGAIVGRWHPELYAMQLDRSTPALIASGLLVGWGTQVGGGCTSGHGVCGIGRFSRRSIVATLTFMFTAAVSVYVVEHLLGGRV
ncbi:MAG: YeeE/YedE family protein [Polyangiales bacterium]